MTTPSAPDIEIRGIRVGKGLRPLTQSGLLTVQDGVLTLYNGKGKVINSGPTTQVTVKKNTFPITGIRLKIGSVGYNLDNNHVTGAGPGWLTVSRDLGFVPRFLQVMEQAGASVKR